jgi:ABC-type nitrate/sulfonate/bicarbonate transport system permease component
MAPGRRILTLLIGIALIPAIWTSLKVTGLVSDRVLPSLPAVVAAAMDIEPSIFVHFASTGARLIVGLAIGTVLGIAIGILVNLGRTTADLILPMLHALRAIPAAAAVPFFLLWFGFSETGRVLLVVIAVATNVAVAAANILSRTPERYAIMFRGFGIDGHRLIRAYALPMVLSGILPTLRFSLALVIGAQTVSELLGAQVGLGYVIQNARSTFSLPALFLAMILLGVMTAGADAFLCWLWRRMIYWERGVVK